MVASGRRDVGVSVNTATFFQGDRMGLYLYHTAGTLEGEMRSTLLQNVDVMVKDCATECTN